MPGMGHGLLSDNPIVVAAFRALLRQQGLLVLIFMAVLLLALAARVWVSSDASAPDPARRDEPRPRWLLRVVFGILWLFDGALQGQALMPLGMPTQVVQPAAASSPQWVQNLVSHGLSVWTLHPVSAAASAVWIQVGIGLMILFAPRGWWSRAAGLVSAGWGLAVWVFGEAFGGIFGSGLSWMFGAPGAALLYALAGLLIALPDRSWLGRRLGQLILGSTGAFFLAMAVLQAWPGRGFWQGQPTPQATAGSLTAMVQTMGQIPQPRPLASTLSWFAQIDAHHGWAVNLVSVIALAAVGAGMLAVALAWRPRLAAGSVIAAAVLCVADWVFVQDLGFFGGVGTDPNSMLPLLVLIVVGYLAASRPIASADTAPQVIDQTGRTRWLGAASAVCAMGVILVGALPMASASMNSHADPILSLALNGDPGRENTPAPPFNLVDQNGQPVSLASLRGRSIALTFLDPVCTTDCPLIAQEFRQADQSLGTDVGKHTVFIAVVANPIYRSLAVVQAFNKQEHLDHISNWLFLTGSLSALQAMWNGYGYEVQALQNGGMVAHSEVAYIIDPSGNLRTRLGSDPGAAGPTSASLATLLADELRAVTPS